MYRRWYMPERGGFGSQAPYPPLMEHVYSFASQSSPNSVDPTGERNWYILGGTCCNKSGGNEWALVGAGGWELLKPGECTGLWEDCDGMTCGGGLYNLANSVTATCKTPGCDSPKYAKRRWTNGAGTDGEDAASPWDRGLMCPLPPGYEWGYRDTN